MSAGEVTIRSYRRGDEDAIQEAFEAVFAKRRPLADWRWKFEQPPRGSRISLAFDAGGRLLCQYAAIVLDVAWSGETILAGQIVDVLSRAGGGLGRRGTPFLRTVEDFLADAAAGGLAFIYGFPGERHQRVGEIAGLYNRTAPIERLTCELEAPWPETPRGALTEGFDAAALDRLWGRSRTRYRAAAVRDAAWFAWRYAARPRSDYAQLGVRRGGQCRAWGVLAADGETARWVDLVWDGESPADLAALAAAIARRARESGATRLELWLQGDPAARKALLECGFASGIDPERRLSVIVLDPGLELDAVLSGLYLTLGDSDHL